MSPYIPKTALVASHRSFLFSPCLGPTEEATVSLSFSSPSFLGLGCNGGESSNPPQEHTKHKQLAPQNVLAKGLHTAQLVQQGFNQEPFLTTISCSLTWLVQDTPLQHFHVKIIHSIKSIWEGEKHELQICHPKS